MNVLNQLDSESSSDSDGNAMEDRFAVEDGGHSENESDQVTNISSQAVSIESDSPMRSGNSSVSLLSVLKAPNMSELSRKRKVTKNPPTGKRRARSSCPSNQKVSSLSKGLKNIRQNHSLYHPVSFFARGVGKNCH